MLCACSSSAEGDVGVVAGTTPSLATYATRLNKSPVSTTLVGHKMTTGPAAPRAIPGLRAQRSPPHLQLQQAVSRGAESRPERADQQRSKPKLNSVEKISAPFLSANPPKMFHAESAAPSPGWTQTSALHRASAPRRRPAPLFAAADLQGFMNASAARGWLPCNSIFHQGCELPPSSSFSSATCLL